MVSPGLYWAVELPSLPWSSPQNYICVVTIPQWEQLCKYSFNSCIILHHKNMIHLTILLLLSKCHFPIVGSYKNHFSEHICTQIFVPFNMKSHNDGTEWQSRPCLSSRSWSSNQRKFRSSCSSNTCVELELSVALTPVICQFSKRLYGVTEILWEEVSP